MRPTKIFIHTLFFTFLLAGCQFRNTVSPPPYLGIPQEISAYEVKGLEFVSTVTFRDLFAENNMREYAKKHHYRYYVVTMRSTGFKGRAERITAMMYR